jgi:hypothetical protein
MISAVDHQPAGADWVARVEEIFSPTGILPANSIAKNKTQGEVVVLGVNIALDGICPSGLV